MDETLKISMPELKELIKEVFSEAGLSTQPTNVKETGVSNQIINIYSQFDSALSQYKINLIRKYEIQLNNMLRNKKVSVRASLSFGNPEKDYIIERVKEVKINFYFDKYIIVLVGPDQDVKKKDREHLIDRDAVSLKILSSEENLPNRPVPTPRSTGINPTMKQNVQNVAPQKGV
jgi:hypothetical protein